MTTAALTTAMYNYIISVLPQQCTMSVTNRTNYEEYFRRIRDPSKWHTKYAIH